MKLWPRHGGDQSITMLLCAESRRMELLHTTDRVSWYKGLEIVVEVMYSLTKLGGQMRGYASGRRPPKSPTGSTSPPRSRRKPQPPAPQGPHNAYYEAGWTDSWSHRHCLHEHRTLLEAAACAAGGRCVARGAAGARRADGRLRRGRRPGGRAPARRGRVLGDQFH